MAISSVGNRPTSATHADVAVDRTSNVPEPTDTATRCRADESTFDGPTGTVKQGDATYVVEAGQVSLNGRHIGTVDDAGNYDVTIGGQRARGNVSDLVGAAVDATLSTGARIDTAPSGRVDVSGRHFTVREGVVKEHGRKVGTLNDRGEYDVTLDGRHLVGSVRDLPGARVELDGRSYRIPDVRTPRVGIDPRPTWLDEQPPRSLIDPREHNGFDDRPRHRDRFVDPETGRHTGLRPIDCDPSPRVGIDPRPEWLGTSGAQSAQDVERFGATHGLKPEYVALALDPQLLADAEQYLRGSPQLMREADDMVRAMGDDIHPAKVARLRADFALMHYANEHGAGREWPSATAGRVDAMLSAPPGSFPEGRTVLPYETLINKGRSQFGALTEYATEGRNNVTLATAVSSGAHAVVNMDGTGNRLDFCSRPYPSATGRGDAVLGGTRNQGQLDLTGTLVVRAGDHNAWTVKDPSVRCDGTSEWAQQNRATLSEQAHQSKIVLEGNSADWAVRTSRDEATYVNSRTGTSVTIPSSAQAQVSYLDTAQLDALATKVRAGEGS